MRNGLRLFIATAALTLPATATASAFEYGDPVPLVTGRAPEVRAASSGPRHATALHLFERDDIETPYSVVAIQDRAGRWHRFKPSGEPERVALAQLEGGAGLAAWADGGHVYVRTWSRDGK